jgi:DNA-binding GntR family transcriptional regulator
MPIPSPTPQFKRALMRDEVYNTLLEWIIEGKLRPGEKLLDTELAETLGVSRTPIREALKRLEDRDLVEAAANRWTRVTQITVDAAELIYPILWTLEPLAVYLAGPYLSQKDCTKLAQYNNELKQSLKAKDPVGASMADVHFHEIFVQQSRNLYLINIIADLKIKLRRLEVLYFEGTACASDSIREHDQIISAIKKGSLGEASELVRSNWKGSLARLRTNPTFGAPKDSQERGNV